MKADRSKRSPDKQRPRGRWPASPVWPGWGRSLGSWEGLWSPLVGTRGPLCIVPDIVPGAYMGRLQNSYQTYLRGAIMILKFRDSYTEAGLKPQFLEAFCHTLIWWWWWWWWGSLDSDLCSAPVPEPRNLRRCLGLVSSVRMHHLGSC